MIHSIEEGRKQDGNRSIADKIIKRLHDLEKTVDTNYGRWAWELLQNAKDSVADDTRSVDVELSLKNNKVTFSHNGNHFTEHDIRGLINQISSKEVEDNAKSTRVGRFGTGFITTHLLSKIVYIKGVVETESRDIYQFEFPLDREGSTTTVLVPKIEATWQNFHQSIRKIAPDALRQFTTSFTYILNSERELQTAQKGIEEFIRLMPFVLAFNHRIGKVTIVNEGQIVEIERNAKYVSDFIIEVTKTENFYPQSIHIAVCSNDIAAVAIEIDPETNSIKELKEFPRIFCDFPLIGTEKFYFPVVVNSFYFNPQTERDGIWLRGDEDNEVKTNCLVLEQCIKLYQELLLKLSNSEIKKLYFAATTKLPVVNEKFFDEDWYKQNIQHSLRQIIVTIPIVDTISHGRCAIEDTLIYFPHHDTKSGREKLWELGNKIRDSHLILPEKSSIDFWDDIIWEKKYRLDLEQYAIFFNQRFKNIEDLASSIGEEKAAFIWLNEFYDEINNEMKVELFNKFELVPNQNGIFKKIFGATKSDVLLFNDEIKDNTLVEITRILNSDWKEYLIHSAIDINITSHKLEKKGIADAISKVFVNNKNEWTNSQVKSIVLLTEWFEQYPELGKELFPEMYRRRAELFMKTIEDKESLYHVMKSKTPLKELADLTKAIQNDPEILNIIAIRQQEIIEEKERNAIGEAVENILAELLTDLGFSIQKAHVGRDLIISIGRGISFDIEVKSTKSGGFVAMTPTQAKTAFANRNNYALCVVHTNGQKLTKESIRANAKIIINIGELIASKVSLMQNFMNSQQVIFNSNENVSLFVENPLIYKYKISQNIWQQGLNIEEFVQLIKSMQ